tara:strand:+ start:1223 stop:1468 length:246 start_codon:yes stop_codon:yes gene_type:complete
MVWITNPRLEKVRKSDKEKEMGGRNINKIKAAKKYANKNYAELIYNVLFAFHFFASPPLYFILFPLAYFNLFTAKQRVAIK